MNHNKKINWLLLVICIGLPLAVGGLSALLTRNSMKDFAILNQPPLAPPGWLFSVVPDFDYCLSVLSEIKGGRTAPYTLSALGSLCRLSEPGDLFAELIYPR